MKKQTLYIKDKMKASFNENLTMLRKRKGLNQPEFGKLIGIKVGQMGKYETGKSVPDLKLLFKMCDVLECSLEDLAGV